MSDNQPIKKIKQEKDFNNNNSNNQNNNNQNNNHNNNNQNNNHNNLKDEIKEGIRGIVSIEGNPRFEMNQIIKHHYNSRIEPGDHSKERSQSRILGLRNFNNAIKSILISKVTSDIYEYVGKDYPISVLDLGGGKGGDLKKYMAANIKNYVLADIPEISVQDARIRYNNLKCQFHAKFISGDCWKDGLLDQLEKDMKFDIVSCQFALHYSFETEKQAKGAVANIAKRLKEGGYFIGTVPDANYFVKRIRNSEGLSFGNEHFKVEFEQKDTFPLFGARYLFSLEDAVDQVPEFLINIRVLENLLKPYDIELIHILDPRKKFTVQDSHANFHTFYQQYVNSRKKSGNSTKFGIEKLLESTNLSPAQWEVARNILSQKPYPPPKPVAENEVLHFH